jgi:hypothetical protein
MISILLDVRSSPDVLGYKDRITVLKDDRELLYHGDWRGTPNPYKPKTDPRVPWQNAYPWVADGEYSWAWYPSPKHGPCLLLENGDAVPTRLPNPEQGGKNFAKWIELHPGESDWWPGSAGCLTGPPADWPKFIVLFKEGDTGLITIRTLPGVV